MDESINIFQEGLVYRLFRIFSTATSEDNFSQNKIINRYYNQKHKAYFRTIKVVQISIYSLFRHVQQSFLFLQGICFQEGKLLKFSFYENLLFSCENCKYKLLVLSCNIYGTIRKLFAYVSRTHSLLLLYCLFFHDLWLISLIQNHLYYPLLKTYPYLTQVYMSFTV